MTVKDLDLIVGINIDPPVDQTFETSGLVLFPNAAGDHAEFIATYGTFDGAIYLDTTNNVIRIRINGTWQTTSNSFIQTDNNTVWDGVLKTKVYTVSSSILDARTAIWQFRNDSGNVFNPDLALTQTTVTVTFGIAPTSDSYLLIGKE